MGVHHCKSWSRQRENCVLCNGEYDRLKRVEKLARNAVRWGELCDTHDEDTNNLRRELGMEITDVG